MNTSKMFNPAIVIVAYNRISSFKRILQSVLNADYGDGTEIPLVISIDGGGTNDIVETANAVEWKYGKKIIIKHSDNLGLRKHVLSCGDLSNQFGSVIILEDDCVVSKNFYAYSCNALDYYKEDDRIAGIGLYSYLYNENVFLPFSPLFDGKKVYFIQFPCSWGQAWTNKQWQEFRGFYDTNPVILPEDKIPESVKQWPESSWKKYFAKYMAERNKYFVYPDISYSTTFADIGVHWKDTMSFFQVPLEMQEAPDFGFVPFDESYNKYDAYFEMLPESLIYFGAEISPDTCMDIYGSKQMDLMNNKYWLSSKQCHQPIKSFGADMAPLVQNILYNNEGDIFSYAVSDKFSATVPPPVHNRILKKQQPLGYYFASKTRYYKLGYYFLHPLFFIRKQIKQRL